MTNKYKLLCVDFINKTLYTDPLIQCLPWPLSMVHLKLPFLIKPSLSTRNYKIWTIFKNIYKPGWVGLKWRWHNQKYTEDETVLFWLQVEGGGGGSARGYIGNEHADVAKVLPKPFIVQPEHNKKKNSCSNKKWKIKTNI